MEQEILDFIKRRFPKDSNWLDGNCYWFAFILCERFPNLQIYYEPIRGHFVAGTPSRYYDWTGINHDGEKPILLAQIENEDPSWYQRLLRDCKN